MSNELVHTPAKSSKDNDKQNRNQYTRKEVTKKNCKPVDNVVFLKTHKTGSSTILNILQRYSDHRNLSMVLPGLPEANHKLGWPNMFTNKYVFEHEEGRKYNVFANHARFTKQNILNMMKDPKNTKFVTILRDPLYQLESSAAYFGYNKIFNISRLNMTARFLEKTENDRDELWKMTRRPRESMLYLVKNPNAFDLGFRTWIENEESILKAVDTVRKDFNLVMISDYMLESLVLLKDELCWDLEDVTHFTLNKRPKKNRQPITDTPQRREQIRNWSSIDYALFDYYNQTLWHRIAEKGEQFQRDVEKLKTLNKDFREKCIDSGTHYDKSQPWFHILGYKVKEDSKNKDYYELCKQMTRAEIDYNNVLREKQSRKGWITPTKKPKLKKLPSKKKNLSRPRILN